MLQFTFRKRSAKIRRLMSTVVVFIFGFYSVVTPAAAQLLPALPLPGTTVGLSGSSLPPVLWGMKIHPENPLLFDFIVDRGNTRLTDAQLRTETEKLVKYFLAALTLPDKDVWVNLSPYEQDRILPETLSRTEMGKAMLEQDYLLKQLSSSLTNPNEKLGQEYWSRVKARVHKELGTTVVAINTFNKVWIVPAKAKVIESGSIVLVDENQLNVMMAEDFESLKNSGDQQRFVVDANGLATVSPDQIRDQVAQISSEVFCETILPDIEREINQGKNFAQVRQIYNAVILAAWYKQTLKESLLGKVYVDQAKVAGVETDDKKIKQKIYEQYLAAFRKGVYNLIKEDQDIVTGQMIPRKYFSGGAILAFGHKNPLKREKVTDKEIGKVVSRKISVASSPSDIRIDWTTVQLGELDAKDISDTADSGVDNAIKKPKAASSALMPRISKFSPVYKVAHKIWDDKAHLSLVLFWRYLSEDSLDFDIKDINEVNRYFNSSHNWEYFRSSGLLQISEDATIEEKKNRMIKILNNLGYQTQGDGVYRPREAIIEKMTAAKRMLRFLLVAQTKILNGKSLQELLPEITSQFDGQVRTDILSYLSIMALSQMKDTVVAIKIAFNEQVEGAWMLVGAEPKMIDSQKYWRVMVKPENVSPLLYYVNPETLDIKIGPNDHKAGQSFLLSARKGSQKEVILTAGGVDVIFDIQNPMATQDDSRRRLMRTGTLDINKEFEKDESMNPQGDITRGLVGFSEDFILGPQVIDDIRPESWTITYESNWPYIRGKLISSESGLLVIFDRVFIVGAQATHYEYLIEGMGISTMIFRMVREAVAPGTVVMIEDIQNERTIENLNANLKSFLQVGKTDKNAYGRYSGKDIERFIELIKEFLLKKWDYSLRPQEEEILSFLEIGYDGKSNWRSVAQEMGNPSNFNKYGPDGIDFVWGVLQDLFIESSPFAKMLEQAGFVDGYLPWSGSFPGTANYGVRVPVPEGYPVDSFNSRSLSSAGSIERYANTRRVRPFYGNRSQVATNLRVAPDQTEQDLFSVLAYRQRLFAQETVNFFENPEFTKAEIIAAIKKAWGLAKREDMNSVVKELESLKEEENGLNTQAYQLVKNDPALADYFMYSLEIFGRSSNGGTYYNFAATAYFYFLKQRARIAAKMLELPWGGEDVVAQRASQYKENLNDISWDLKNILQQRYLIQEAEKQFGANDPLLSSTPMVKEDREKKHVGGIDFDPALLNLQIKRDSRGVPLPLPQQNIDQINIEGFYPVIINIQPVNVKTLPLFLGKG